ncbi:MAG: hypothetical protein ABIJ45_02910, partial [Candidatus Zixiibacteriota bacterium]
FLAQGTLRPDLIESGNPDVSTTAHKIKTHHNDVEMIRRARDKGMVVETNWDWHKDEVRQVARKLGIDEIIASRQPFPGPGLAIRTICYDGKGEVEQSTLDEFRKVISVLGNEYSGTVLPIKSVGVQGDFRSYRSLSLIWGMGMELDWGRVYKTGTELPNKVHSINRVAYVLNRERITFPLKCHELYINKHNLDLLREVDYLVTEALAHPPMSQVLAVLVPVGIENKLSIAIRTFVTNDFMTGRPAIIGKDINKDILSELVSKIDSFFSEIDLILYDVTSKPPATVEWQ